MIWKIILNKFNHIYLLFFINYLITEVKYFIMIHVFFFNSTCIFSPFSNPISYSLLSPILKGIESVISSDPPCKNSKRYPKNLNLIKNVECKVAFFWLEKYSLLLICKKCTSHFCRETEHGNEHFKETNTHGNLIHTWSDKGFMGYGYKSAISCSKYRPNLHSYTKNIPR